MVAKHLAFAVMFLLCFVLCFVAIKESKRIDREEGLLRYDSYVLFLFGVLSIIPAVVGFILNLAWAFKAT